MGEAVQQSAGEPFVPRQLYLPVPVASLRNVTEISSPGTTFNQRQFPQWMFVPSSFAGYGVNQFTRHCCTRRWRVRRCALSNRPG